MPNEMKITAYFNSPDEAESAAVSLKALGAIEVGTDRLPDTDSGEQNMAIPPNLSFSGTLTTSAGTNGAGLYTGLASLGDDDTTEGYSSNQRDHAFGTDKDTILTAKVEESLLAKAEEMIKENGGSAEIHQ